MKTKAGSIEGVGSAECGVPGNLQYREDATTSDLDSHPPVPPTQDDDLWLEATIEETESEWWL